MIDNKHFIQFLNKIGITVKQMSEMMNMTYATAKNRVDTLNFTMDEIRRLSQAVHVVPEEIFYIVSQKKTIKEIGIPYALTKEIAWEKIKKEDDFIRLILECNFIGSGQRGRKATQTEIDKMKKYLLLKTIE